MSKRKLHKTQHSAIRISERCNITDSSTKDLIKLAYRKGLTYSKFDGKVRDYILRRMGDKCNGRYKVVVYRGYLFIFAHNKNLLVTMYELPEDIKIAYNEQYEAIKEKRYGK